MGESKTRLSNSANIPALKPHIPLGNLTGNVFHIFATSENFIYSRHGLNGSLARRLSWPVHEKEDVGQGNCPIYDPPFTTVPKYSPYHNFTPGDRPQTHERAFFHIMYLLIITLNNYIYNILQKSILTIDVNRVKQI